MLRPAVLMATLVLGAVSLAGCGGNQTAALQDPGIVSGTVSSRAPCPSEPIAHACSQLIALVPGALVQALGKDGTHEVHADRGGRYRISLTEGVWDLEASRAAGAPTSPPVQVELKAGGAVTVNLDLPG